MHEANDGLDVDVSVAGGEACRLVDLVEIEIDEVPGHLAFLGLLVLADGARGGSPHLIINGPHREFSSMNFHVELNTFNIFGSFKSAFSPLMICQRVLTAVPSD